MCGIAGFWDGRAKRAPASQLRAIAGKLASCLAHRGPDAEGVFIAADSGLALAHRRLSILDLSPAGAQPMHSPSGRFVLILNGEIYNFHELRGQLQDRFCFRGHSDTEVLLAAIESWGLEATLQKCVGMFALAVWDRQQRLLQLARDRMGEKPLYYAWQDRLFLFGSELKAMRRHPDWRPSLNPAALREYIRYGFIPGPLSIYQNCFKLLPGTILDIRLESDVAVPRAYWSLAAAATALPRSPAPTPAGAVDELDGRLRQAIKDQMVADVPVGAFLSGGIDSSAVVALMQALGNRPVQTFSIGFSESTYNEADFARRIAAHLGTDHTELIVTPADCLGVIPALPRIFDEPFADSSQIPTFLVARLARSRVTVSLSGDGGDELFGGYNRYAKAARAWRLVRICPASLRHMLGHGVRLVERHRKGASKDAAAKLAAFLANSCGQRQHQATLSVFCNPETWMQSGAPPLDQLPSPALPGRPLIEQLMFYDCLTYLPDDILVKVDRTAMAVSLETRVPLLDHRLVEWTWSLSLGCKSGAGEAKGLLRQVLARYVPRAMFDRPKMGFGVPLAEWLRGPLRAWAGDLLSEQTLASHGLLAPSAVVALWRKHLAGADHAYQLWILLMLQAWNQEQLSVPAPSSEPSSVTS